MKSKAQQYADYSKLVVPVRPEFGDTAYVYQDGDLYLATAKLSPEGALALRDWLTDTFDVPKASNVPPNPEPSPSTDWVKDIKLGFVGRTRNGHKAVFKGVVLPKQPHKNKCYFYIWRCNKRDYLLNDIITYLSDGTISDFDIVGPWEEDGEVWND